MLPEFADVECGSLFLLRYNDVTNAFKLYRRSAIAGIQPLLSQHFNLTVELPLKCIIRGHKYAVLPNSWKNRKQGVSKLRIKEILREMEIWMDEHEYESVAQMIGSMSQKHCAEPAAFERANYMKILDSYRPVN